MRIAMGFKNKLFLIISYAWPTFTLYSMMCSLFKIPHNRSFWSTSHWFSKTSKPTINYKKYMQKSHQSKVLVVTYISLLYKKEQNSQFFSFNSAHSNQLQLAALLCYKHHTSSFDAVMSCHRGSTFLEFYFSRLHTLMYVWNVINQCDSYVKNTAPWCFNNGESFLS